MLDPGVSAALDVQATFCHPFGVNNPAILALKLPKAMLAILNKMFIERARV